MAKRKKSALEDTTTCRRCGKLKPPPRDRSTAICVECEAATDCRHYLGFHEGCALGVDIDELTAPVDGSAYRKPCHFMEGGTPVHCGNKELYTIEEVLQEDQRVEARIRRMDVILPLIVQVKIDCAGKNWAGVRECPVCKGKLRMTHAAVNGHVHGRRNTPDCVSWME